MKESNRNSAQYWGKDIYMTLHVFNISNVRQFSDVLWV